MQEDINICLCNNWKRLGQFRSNRFQAYIAILKFRVNSQIYSTHLFFVLECLCILRRTSGKFRPPLWTQVWNRLTYILNNQITKNTFWFAKHTINVSSARPCYPPNRPPRLRNQKTICRSPLPINIPPAWHEKKCCVSYSSHQTGWHMRTWPGLPL